MTIQHIAAPLVGIGLTLALGVTAFPRTADAADPEATADTEATVTQLTAGLLENWHVTGRRIDAERARMSVRRYLDVLDGSRTLFLRSDEAAFLARPASFADALHAGDVTLVHDIFHTYLERLAERAALVAATLRGPELTFEGKDVYAPDRRHAERPGDLAAARALWRTQLRAEYLEQKLAGQAPAAVAAALSHRYAQELDAARRFTPADVLADYLDALARAYDPHSAYLGQEGAESLSISMNLALTGIGLAVEQRHGYSVIRGIHAGGPAARSHALRPGDRIVAVAQAGEEPVDVVGMPLAHVVELVRGPRGTAVTLKVLRAGAADGAPPDTVTLVRDHVSLHDQEAQASVVDLPRGDAGAVRLGVVRLPSFYDGKDGAAAHSASADVARLLGELVAAHVQGVVLDLRDDLGGSADEAVRLAGLFLPQGPIVQTRGRKGAIRVASDPDPRVVYDGPLLVLTSRSTASASEIVAGALQDYGRAVIVGDASTFGKGTVQNAISLAEVLDGAHVAHAFDPGAVEVTVSKFYRPGGASTQLRGVASDVVLPAPADGHPTGESTNEGALAWDSIPAAPFVRQDRVAPFLGSLRRLSAERVGRDAVLHALQLRAERAKRRPSTVSLNEGVRRAELAHETEEEAALTRAERASPAGGAPEAAAFVLREAERILGDYVELQRGSR